MTRFTAAFRIILVVCFVLANRIDGEESSASKRLLATKSFKLISRISKNFVNSPKKRQTIEEFYSNDQKRARIVVEREEGSSQDRPVYFYDASRKGLFVEHNTDPKSQLKCKQVDDSTYLESLLGFKIPASAKGNEALTRGADWLRETHPDVPNHLVGLARIAFWIEAHRKDLQPLKADDQRINLNVQNVIVTAHALPGRMLAEFPIPADEVVAYYPINANQKDWFGLPLGVDIKRKDSDWIFVQFMNVASAKNDLEQMNSRVPLDMFAYPVGIDCGKGLKPVDWVYSTSDLSFRMELLDYTIRGPGAEPASVSEQFIAYDSVAKLLRVDAYTFYKYSISIIDLINLNRFNIYHGTQTALIDRDIRGNYKASSMFDRKFSEGGCIKTPLYLPSSKASEPFFSFKKMILMGRAKIRGVDCRAFEMTTDELPLSMFPPITYTQTEGRTMTSYIVGEDTKGASYNIVYYFAANPATHTKRWIAEYNREETVGSLMRVDVYLRGELLYHLDISEFSFGKLVDAPNGDKTRELFSVRDRCNSDESGALDHAKLNAELTLKITDGSRASAKDVAAKLSSSSLRTQAVVRTLSKSSNRLLTNMYDAETQLKLTDHDEELKVFLEARLNHPDIPNTWPKLIGYAIPVERQFAASSAECLVYASLLKPSDSTVVVNCPHQCVGITNPGLQFSEDGKKIVDFNKNIFQSVEMTKVSGDHCPLLSIETSSSSVYSEQAHLEMSKWIHEELGGNTLYLQLPGLESDNMKELGISGVSATVNHIDISNDRWSTSVGLLGGVAALSAVEKDSVDGVGLTKASGQEQGVSFKVGDEQVSMDYNHCHSLCSSKPECHSFSTCLTSRGTECIISEVDFREAAFLEQIERKRAELNSSTGRKTVLVPNASTSKDVEIFFDLRCKIHKRNALEMFHKVTSVHLELRNTTLISVESLEKCAELCWQNNVIFFNTMDKVVEEFGENADSDATAEKMKAELDKHRANWCSNFYFLNLAYSSDYDWVKRLVNEKSLDKAGLCIPIKPLSFKDDTNHPIQWYPPAKQLEKQPMPMVGKFEFVYKSLYRAEYGKRIAENSNEAKKGQQVKMYLSDEESCAKACFLQTEEVEPQCKSFDMIEARSLSTGKMSRYCVLHANTIEDLEKNGLSSLVEELSGGSEQQKGLSEEKWVRSWHLEPKLHAMSSSMVVRRAVVRIESEESPHQVSSIRVHKIGIFFIVLASIACTAIIVKLKGDAVVKYFDSPRRGSKASFAGSLNNFE